MRPSASFYLLRVFLVALIFGLISMGTFAKRGWLDWCRIDRQNAELQDAIDAARRQIERDERQIEALQTRPSAQERVIRQVLGYVRPNETVIEFD